jgi:hypothetical protein
MLPPPITIVVFTSMPPERIKITCAIIVCAPESFAARDRLLAWL